LLEYAQDISNKIVRGGDLMKTPAKSSQLSVDAKPMRSIVVFLLGIYYLVISILLIYLLVIIWPTSDVEYYEESIQKISIFWGLSNFSISKEVLLIMIVIAAGGLGSFIHGATSLISFIGNRKIVKSWAWWYILRPFIGSTLALIFYFVIRGGFFSVSAGVEDISHFGIAASAGLVGMFSKEAIDKLRDVFLALFRPKDQRKDKL
jgi:hypothetical protein